MSTIQSTAQILSEMDFPSFVTERREIKPPPMEPIIRILRQRWYMVIVAELIPFATPLRMEGDTLVVQVTKMHSGLIYSRDLIRDRVNRLLPEFRVTDVQLVLKPKPPADPVIQRFAKDLKEYPLYCPPPETSFPKYVPSNSDGEPDALDSFRYWERAMAEKASRMATCPKCSLPANQGEMDFWGHCLYCQKEKITSAFRRPHSFSVKPLLKDKEIPVLQPIS